jgi:hypothetical protein
VSRFVGAARVPVGGGEVVARAQGVGVLRAQDAFAGGQDLLVQGNRLIEAARVLIGESEVVARVQNAGVVRAQDAFAGGQDLLVDSSRAIICSTSSRVAARSSCQRSPSDAASPSSSRVLAA